MTHRGVLRVPSQNTGRFNLSTKTFKNFLTVRADVITSFGHMIPSSQ